MAQPLILPRSASQLWAEFVSTWPLPEQLQKPWIIDLKRAADREWMASQGSSQGNSPLSSVDQAGAA